MLFVGYGAPASPSHSHHPSSSATVHTIRSSSLSSDAIEADLRALYSQALRLQNTKRHTAALGLYRRILTHKCYQSHRAQHSSHSHYHDRVDGGEEEEVVVDGADRGLEQLWRLTWRNVGDVYQSDGRHHIALHCYHTALASNHTAHTHSSVATASMRPLLLSLARSAVHVGQLSLARRTLESALIGASNETDGSEWDVVDALVDVLYCIGDHHALTALLEAAVQRDGGYVKGVLLYSQLYAASPSSLSLSTAVYAHCQRQLKRVPRQHVRAVTQQLLQLTAAQRSLADMARSDPATGEPSAIHRTIVVSAASPLTSLATSLLALYNELTRVQKQKRKLMHTTDSLTVHQLLRLMKSESSHVSEQELMEVARGESAVSRASSTATIASASSVVLDVRTASSLTAPTMAVPAHLLNTPVVLILSDTSTASPLEAEIIEKSVDDAVAVILSDDSKDESAERSARRLAAVHYAQAAVGDDVTFDHLTLSFDHHALTPLPTASGASRPPTASSVRRSQPVPFSDAVSLLSSFLSLHASSTLSNSGCVDVMQRYLRWLRETCAVGVNCGVLTRIVEVLWRCRLLSDGDDAVDELLFCAEIVLDAHSSSSTAHTSTHASILSWLVAQLSLYALSPASELSVTQRVRLSHVRAHRLLFDNDVPAATNQLQSTIDLLSAHPASSPVPLPHCAHIESISPSTLQGKVERLKARQLLHELSELSANSSHSAVVDTFMTAHSAEPMAFEQRLLALTDTDKRRMITIVLHAADKEKHDVREWQVRRIHGRLLAAQLLPGDNSQGNIVDEIRGWCERVLSLFTTLVVSASPPKREDVLDMLRALTVSLSLLFQPSSSAVDQLDVPLITAINKLAMYYHREARPLSPSLEPSSAFQLHLSLLSSSHRLLARVNGCRTAAGRALLFNHLDSLFQHCYLLLHEHHSVASLLPLLPPLPTCFMPCAPPTPASGPTPSIARPASMVLSESSWLLSDLCDLFSPSYPSHLSDKSHCTVRKDEMLSTPLWRARLLHLLSSHILTQHESTGSVAVVKELRESILACLEQLAAYTPRPIVPSSSFIDAYLTHPPSLSLASSFALVPHSPVVWGDELTTQFYRFHGHYILPAYIQRVNEADDWYSNASYRREWESEQALLSSLTTLCLLSNPTSPYLWYSLGLLHWEPAQRELSSAYAELCIDPLHLTRQQGERAGKRREEEERERASGWVEKVNRCTRCFLYCLHLLNIEFGGSDATLQQIFEAADNQLANAESSGIEVARPDSMDKRLVLIVWEKLAFLAYRLAQMMQYLPFLRGEEAAVSAIRVIPPHFTRRRTVSPVTVAAIGPAREDSAVVAVDELHVSYSCFRVAAQLAPRHWVVEYMMGKCASKMDRLPHGYIQHFQTAAELCYQQWKQQRDTATVSTESVEGKAEVVEMEADTVTTEEVDEAGGPALQDGDNTEDEEDEDDECRMNVYPLYRLHSWRLKLAEHVRRLVTHTDTCEADVVSVEGSRSKLPVWDEAEREEVLMVLEASSFIPTDTPSRSPSPNTSSASDEPLAELPSSALGSSLFSVEATLVTRCEAVLSNVALAMHECIRRDSRCYSALTKLAHIWLDRQSTTKLRWLTNRLQPFAHYPRSKPLNKFDKMDSRTVDTELHAFSAHPRQLDWWQYTPWRGCAGYFKCLERYVQLLVQLRSLSGFLSLYTLVNLARRLPDLPAIKRLHVYGRYLLLLLERLARDGGDCDASGGAAASEYELLCQRACEVCVQLHDQNIHMQRLLVLAYVVQHQRTGRAVDVDLVDHSLVRKWLMEQRWARRLNVGDLIGGSMEDEQIKQIGISSGSKRRREDDSSRDSAERMDVDGNVEHRSKRVETDSSVTPAVDSHIEQSISGMDPISAVQSNDAAMAEADAQKQHSKEVSVNHATSLVLLPLTVSSPANDAEPRSAAEAVAVDDPTTGSPAALLTVSDRQEHSQPVIDGAQPTVTVPPSEPTPLQTLPDASHPPAALGHSAAPAPTTDSSQPLSVSAAEERVADVGGSEALHQQRQEMNLIEIDIPPLEPDGHVRFIDLT